MSCLTGMVCEMEGKWSFNCCFISCCFQDLFKTTHNIPLNFFFNSANTDTAWKISYTATENLQVEISKKFIVKWFQDMEQERKPKHQSGCPCGVVVKALDFGIVVSKFKLQSRYYIHFRTNTFGKSMNSYFLPAMD